VIPYLASKFTRDQFKRMQIKLSVFNHPDCEAGIDDFNIDQFKNILPKHIDIVEIDIDVDELKEAIQLFDPAVCSFSKVEVYVQLPRDFELLQKLSDKAKYVFV
jgi:glucan phosphorylase